MNNTPKCPYCGGDMVYQFDSSLINTEKIIYRGYFCCSNCHSRSPVVSELSELETIEEVEDEARLLNMERVEPKNRVLTLEEATGSDEPVWLEAMSRVFIADVCVSPDARMAQIQTIGKASCAYLPLCDYGVLWRCWLRKPTKEEMEATPWEENRA